jgi:hypothetical protein
MRGCNNASARRARAGAGGVPSCTIQQSCWAHQHAAHSHRRVHGQVACRPDGMCHRPRWVGGWHTHAHTLRMRAAHTCHSSQARAACHHACVHHPTCIPGRVNIIGEHIDYEGARFGPPMQLLCWPAGQLGAAVVASAATSRPGDNQQLVLHSTHLHSACARLAPPHNVADTLALHTDLSR